MTGRGSYRPARIRLWPGMLVLSCYPCVDRLASLDFRLLSVRVGRVPHAGFRVAPIVGAVVHRTIASMPIADLPTMCASPSS